MSDEQKEDVAPLAAGEADMPLTIVDRWPTTQEFMDDKTSDEACTIAAVEILEIQQGLIQSILRINKSHIPAGIKAIYGKKLRSAVSQLYAGMPNQVAERVEMLVMTEQFGGPEKIAELQAEYNKQFEEPLKTSQGDENAFTVAGGEVATGSTADSKLASEGSSPSAPAISEETLMDHSNAPLKQIPVNFENGQFKPYEQPKLEEKEGKLLEFPKRPEAEATTPKEST